MASESGQESSETHGAVDDVIESIERFASRHWMHDEGQNVREFAARLKAAWKREREELREAATEKMLEGATIIDNRGHGNAAAMREALEGMCKASQDVFRSFARETFYGERRLDSLGVAFDKAKAALSAPPRNCDRFMNAHEAQVAYRRETESERQNEDAYWPCIFDWLFAPAAERKGEGDGSK